MSALRFTSVQQVVEAYPNLQTDLASGLSEGDPLAALDTLAKGETPEDAITFCAYLLDRRRAVWWACQCARKMGSPANHGEDVALKTAEAWVRDPEEHRRLAALDLGMTGDHAFAGTWAALSAGASGGTMKIGELPGPPVPPHLCAKAASAAVLIALATRPVPDRRNFVGACVQAGHDLLSKA
ncbi:MAG: DUF6931 family protein [Beijerinckiaceae bacterium]